jgi:hypothetical protein
MSSKILPDGSKSVAARVTPVILEGYLLLRDFATLDQLNTISSECKQYYWY